MILAIAAEGESKSAYIDSIAFEVNIYLEETTDIENVRFSEFRVSEDCTVDPDLLVGTYDLSKPLFVSLTRFQTYSWEIKCHQDIERYFVVAEQIGESVIDPVAQRVIVKVPEGTDISALTLERIKLGPAGITTLDPDIKPGVIDLYHPLRVDVICHGRTEVWTIYAEIIDAAASTTQIDAWSRVIWAYGSGSARQENGFEYRKTSDSEWTRVPESYMTATGAAFSCYIPHLEPLTEYVVRAFSGVNYGEEITVTTQATADIPNGDFDQWHQEAFSSGLMWDPWPEDGEKFWDTGNKGSMTLKVNLTSPTEYTPTGSGYAAQCKTQFVGLAAGLGKLGTGSIFTGTYVKTDGMNGILDFGRQWNLRPTKLKGYYQYDAKTIDYASSGFNYLKGVPDSCHIYVALTDWTAPFTVRTNPSNRQLFDKNSPEIIAYGELVYSGNMTAYQPFEIKLEYRDTSRVPTYLQITCAASKYGDYFTGGNGSLLYVDQLSFDWDLP